MAGTKKKKSVKTFVGKIRSNAIWTVTHGKLARSAGNPGRVKPLFKAVGEKIPYEFINDVEKHFKAAGLVRKGVYIAHDSMGYPRYIGRGQIFDRLRLRRKLQELELAYFSFFVVEEPLHERQIETIMIRGAGPLLDFNARKVRTDIQAGDVRDFEAGTVFVERQYKKGKKSAVRRTRQSD